MLIHISHPPTIHHHQHQPLGLLPCKPLKHCNLARQSCPCIAGASSHDGVSTSPNPILRSCQQQPNLPAVPMQCLPSQRRESVRALAFSVRAASASAAAAGPSSPEASLNPVQADLVLELPGTSQKIHVFGVEHTLPQPHIGEQTLQLPSKLRDEHVHMHVCWLSDTPRVHDGMQLAIKEGES